MQNEALVPEETAGTEEEPARADSSDSTPLDGEDNRAQALEASQNDDVLITTDDDQSQSEEDEAVFFASDDDGSITREDSGELTVEESDTESSDAETGEQDALEPIDFVAVVDESPKELDEAQLETVEARDTGFDADQFTHQEVSRFSQFDLHSMQIERSWFQISDDEEDDEDDSDDDLE